MKLLYEDINLKTKYSYAIYKTWNNEYVVYECDPDGHRVYIGTYNDYDDAYKLIKQKCK